MTFYELEKECKKRKIKFFAIVMIIFIIISLAFYYFYRNLNFVKKPLKTNSIKTNSKKVVIKKDIKKSNDEKNLSKRVVKLLPIIDLNITSKPIKNKDIKIKQSIFKTEQIPSFKTCINLAKMYFNKKDYKNALKWAKLANIQNKKEPISWIITAKSLYHLGKKKKAVEILKIYNDYYHNSAIKILIRKMNE